MVGDDDDKMWLGSQLSLCIGRGSTGLTISRRNYDELVIFQEK